MGKRKLLAKIEPINTKCGTNIVAGMEIAADIIVSRNQINDVTGIYLLSDGQDTSGIDPSSVGSRVQQMLESKNLGNYSQKGVFTIHTFGYGFDHDPEMMRQIAQYKDGGFYFVDDYSSINTCFLDALGGLFSVVCEDVEVKLKPERKSPFTDLRIYKTYGNAWFFKEDTKEHIIKMNQLIGGVTKDFVLLLNIPPIIRKLAEGEKNRVILNAEFSAIRVSSGQKGPRFSIQTQLILYFINETDIPSQTLRGDDPYVLIQFFRVKTAEALEIAMKSSEQGMYDEAQTFLKAQIQEIQRFDSLKDDDNIKYLLRDLTIGLESCQPKIFELSGRCSLVSRSVAHSSQQSNHLSNTYSSPMQIFYKYKSVI